MTAVVIINESNGGSNGTPGATIQVDGQGANDGTDVRFCTTDAYNDVAVHPCVVPTSGFNYSYWKHISLGISGVFTRVNNICVYTDETIGWTTGTGGGLYFGIRTSGDNGVPMNASYEIATGVEGNSGDSMLTEHLRCSTGGGVALASDYGSASSLLLDSTDYSAADESNALLCQVKIFTDATQGVATDETISFTYDEI
jgi:hypothetical protein